MESSTHPAWLFRKSKIAVPLLERRIRREAKEPPKPKG